MAQRDPATQKRIERLEEQVGRDPASPVFVSLAEEYRKAGDPEEAERVLRDGLARRPAHHSARAALGRILVEGGRPQEARAELERVLHAVPENLLARRLLERIESGDAAPPAAEEDRTTLPMGASVPPRAQAAPVPELPVGGLPSSGRDPRSEAPAGAFRPRKKGSREPGISRGQAARLPSDRGAGQAAAGPERRVETLPEGSEPSLRADELPPAPAALEAEPEPLPEEVWEDELATSGAIEEPASQEEGIRTQQVPAGGTDLRPPRPEIDGRALRLAALQRYLERVRAHAGVPYPGAPGGSA